MKKLCLGMGSIAVTLSPLISTIACAKPEKDGVIEYPETIFDGRETLAESIKNDLNKSANTGWKSVLAIDGSDHSVNDKSFNEYAYKGMKEASVQTLLSSFSTDNIKPAAPDDTQAFLNMYSATADKTLIVAPGFLHTGPLSSRKAEAALANKAVILLDGDVKKTNIASIKFKSHWSGFLAGHMAGNYLNLNYENFRQDGLKVGTFGGLNIPSVTSYMIGFQNGIKHFNSTNAETSHDIEFIDMGSKSEYFSGGFSSGGGRAISEKLVSLKADLIFPVAGPQTLDVESAITKARAKTKIIGVDTAQEESASFPNVVFSALKQLKTATSKMIEIVTGTKSASEAGYEGFKGFGGLTIGNFKNGLVGVSLGRQDDANAKKAHEASNLDEVKTAAKNPLLNPLKFYY